MIEIKTFVTLTMLTPLLISSEMGFCLGWR